MGKIFYLMGKSASGKDSIYKRLRSLCPELKSIVQRGLCGTESRRE